jgi:hypothetical protein
MINIFLQYDEIPFFNFTFRSHDTGDCIQSLLSTLNGMKESVCVCQQKFCLVVDTVKRARERVSLSLFWSSTNQHSIRCLVMGRTKNPADTTNTESRENYASMRKISPFLETNRKG